ncbi:EamA family transporter [Thermoleophilia bacterium SCSIO 60948]|nr:EamA family transporter [Thermoleophilia bacterium SCSIO 60948]
MDRRSWLMLGGLAAIWGASYLQIKIGLRDLSPVVVAWGRVALAALVLVAVAVALGEARGIGRRWPEVIAIGAVQVAGPFTLISLGETAIPSSLAGILVASSTLLTAVLAFFFDPDERSEGLRLFGVLLGLAGVGALLGIDLGGSGSELLGGLAIVLAGLGYAIGGLWIKARMRDVPPTWLAGCVMCGAALVLLPAAVVARPTDAPSADSLIAVGTLGVIGTGVAFALFYSLFARVGPAKTMIVSYLAPAFAVLYGVTLLDEPIGPGAIAGLAMILAGSWFAAGGRLRALRRASPQPP